MPGPSAPDPTQSILEQFAHLSNDELSNHYYNLISFIGSIDAEGEEHFDDDMLTIDLPITVIPNTDTAWHNLENICLELSQRFLANGITFSANAVERMKAFFVQNALAEENERLGCIDTMNKGLRLLYDLPSLKVGGEVQTTMGKMEIAEKVIKKTIIEFVDDAENITTGIRAPYRLSAGIWRAIMEQTGDDFGWSVFGLSIMDGYHSIVLSIDKTIPAYPHLYWSDQWQSHAGWWQYDHQIDDKISELTKVWWDRLPADRKHRTRVTLWRLKP